MPPGATTRAPSRGATGPADRDRTGRPRPEWQEPPLDAHRGAAVWPPELRRNVFFSRQGNALSRPTHPWTGRVMVDAQLNQPGTSFVPLFSSKLDEPPPLAITAVEAVETSSFHGDAGHPLRTATCRALPLALRPMELQVLARVLAGDGDAAALVPGRS